MKRTRNILWGIVLIAIGVIWGLDVLNIIDFTLFFDGWWTLFIIVPSLIDLFTGREKTGSFIGLVIGVVLFLACQDFVSFKIIWKLLIPFIIVVLGVRLIFRDTFRKKELAVFKQVHESGSYKEYSAVFSDQNLDFNNEPFEGAKLTAVFGGIKCDLRKAVLSNDAYVEIESIFGGVDLLLPDNVNVKITSDSVFGGVTNKKASANKENLPTVYVKAACIFGGADIK